MLAARVVVNVTVYLATLPFLLLISPKLEITQAQPQHRTMINSMLFHAHRGSIGNRLNVRAVSI